MLFDTVGTYRSASVETCGNMRKSYLLRMLHGKGRVCETCDTDTMMGRLHQIRAKRQNAVGMQLDLCKSSSGITHAHILSCKYFDSKKRHLHACNEVHEQTKCALKTS